MTNFKTAIPFSIFLLSSTLTSAATFQYAVNLKSGGLLIKEKEILNAGSGSRFELERWYRSRSLFRGFFGQGWCSNLDEKIKLIDKGTIELYTCHSPRPYLFHLNSKAEVYLSPDKPDESIRPGFGSYTRFFKSEELSQYNFQGELKSLSSRGTKWKIKRNSKKTMESLIPEKGEPLTLHWHPDLLLIQQIQSADSLYKFKYDGFLLKSAGSLKYNYNDLDNLTQRFPSSPVFQVKYDNQEDRVLQIESRCLETYQYHKRHQATIKCPEQNTRMAYLNDEGV
ncbi:MAG: DUF6531 domain-containing protein [Bdellovibrionales bacterium]